MNVPLERLYIVRMLVCRIILPTINQQSESILADGTQICL